jgi:thiol-disulfide isomerase/thioredoxin
MKERKLRPWLVLGVFLSIGGLMWIAVPTPFVRGIVLGATLAPGLIIAVLYAFSRRLRHTHGARLQAPALPVSKWDYDMALTDLDGVAVESRTFSGKVLVLNFWATWCAPCVAEMPSLERLAEATSDAGVVVACVTQEPGEAVRSFLEKRGLDVPAYVLADDVPNCFASRGIPATFIIDKKGAVALRHMGAAAWDDAAVVEFVRGLAAVPTT